MPKDNNTNSTSPMRFIDLFCGLGGTRIGFEQACTELEINTECVLSSDKKPSSKIAYKYNFGETIEGDICKIDEKKLPDFDVLLGGFPCQAFSRAGMRRGFNDTRGTMFFEIERILKEKKPRYVLLENVPELLTHDKGNTWRVIKENLEALGYQVSAKVLLGTDFGLAQARKRTFIVAVLAENPIDLDSIEYSSEKKTMKDVIETNANVEPNEYIENLLQTHEAKELAGYMITDKRRGNKTLHSWDFGMHGIVTEKQRHVLETILSQFRKRCWAEELSIRWRDGMPLNLDQLSRATGIEKEELKPILDDLVEMGYLLQKHPYKDDSLEEREDLPIGWKLITSRMHFPIHRILGPDDECITLTATDATHIGVIDGSTIRSLTVREGLRLFGFPEDYDLSCVDDRKAFDLIGNSICVPVVAAVTKVMLEQK